MSSLTPSQSAEEQAPLLDEHDGDDSAIGEDSQSVTTSLAESIYDYIKGNGRTYHAYKDGSYMFPNDKQEADRLDFQHHIFQLLFQDKIYLAPLCDPKNALDVGTGTGIWAIDFADKFPECQVTGIDLSPGQPTIVPPNLKFLVDDAEDTWLYSQLFDYIHARMLSGSISDWARFLSQCYENLESGGWLELQDYSLTVTSGDDTHLDTDLTRWGELLFQASAAQGRPLASADCSDLYVKRMQGAGFVDIQTRMFMLPTNAWPKDMRMKRLGQWNQVNILDGLEGFSLALLTRTFGWQKQEVDVLVARVRRNLEDTTIHASFPMFVVYGKKPFPFELSERLSPA